MVLLAGTAHNALARKKLSIGIQTFADIIEGGYYYVDKTPLIHRLVEEARQR
ncbi:AAA family ATPase [Halomonas sp. R1t8]|uniref:AAA family ATPase n=1 Tax=Halomonas sp. R1t8 TaxID=1904454 RepID=UPI0034608435